MKRAANGQGTIVKRIGKKGTVSWQCRISAKDRYGKRRIISATDVTQRGARDKAKNRWRLFVKRRGTEKEESCKNTGMPIRDHMMCYIEYMTALKQHSDATRHSYLFCRNVISGKIGDCHVKDLNSQIINELLTGLIAKYARSTVVKVRSVLRGYVRYLVRNSILFDDFFDQVDEIPVSHSPQMRAAQTQDEYSEIQDHRIFSENEIVQLFYGDTPMAYDQSVFFLMFLTGMRSQEIRALTVDDINLGEHTIRINKALALKYIDEGTVLICKGTKNRTSTRTIGINAKTEAVVRMILSLRPVQDSRFLVIDRNGRWIKPGCFNARFDAMLKRAHIEKGGRSPHCLRHTFISYGIEKNPLSPLWDKEMLFISRYVGHRNLTITLNVYTHIGENKIKGINYEGPSDTLDICYHPSDSSDSSDFTIGDCDNR